MRLSGVSSAGRCAAAPPRAGAPMPETSAPPDPTLAFGVVAGLEPELLTTLAREVVELGYGGFWINDGGTSQADGLAGLAIVAEAAPTLQLGVGVLPLDRRT